MSTDVLDLRPSKAALRLARVEEQRVDAVRVHEEIAAAQVAREAKTDRLRALRLAKEAADREAAAALPSKPKSKQRKIRAR